MTLLITKILLTLNTCEITFNIISYYKFCLQMTLLITVNKKTCV
jgi:hypothetical protein